MPKEICPACAEKGDKSPKDVKVTTKPNKETKEFLPCHHKAIKVTVYDSIRARDEVEVSHIRQILKQKK
jgi:hypothetical protein